MDRVPELLDKVAVFQGSLFQSGECVYIVLARADGIDSELALGAGLCH